MESRVRLLLKTSPIKLRGSIHITCGEFRLIGKVLTFPTPRVSWPFRLRGVGSINRAESRRDADGSSRHDSNKLGPGNTPRRDSVAAGHVLLKIRNKSRADAGRVHVDVRRGLTLGSE